LQIGRYIFFLFIFLKYRIEFIHGMGRGVKRVVEAERPREREKVKK
jgi:Na+-transporting methylmalonyl-CoA/oxaloacetate decarboxylase gamma subunit